MEHGYGDNCWILNASIAYNTMIYVSEYPIKGLYIWKQVISSEMRSAVSVLSIPGAVGSESDDATLQTRGD